MSETALIAQLEARLATTYSQVSADTVSSAIDSARAHFTDSPIRDFVPLLVERRARALLDHAMTGASLTSS
jgi:hypothetical protein